MSVPKANYTVDPINPHYYSQGKVECIEAMEACSTTAEFCGYLRLTSLKYLWRLHHKDDPLRNIQKANWYLCRLESVMSKTVSPDTEYWTEYWDHKQIEFAEFLDVIESCSGGSTEFCHSLRFYTIQFVWNVNQINNPLHCLGAIKQAIWCLSRMEDLVKELSGQTHISA